MDEKDRKIASNILTALSQADDSQKDYLIGFAEGIALGNERRAKKSKRKKRK